MGEHFTFVRAGKTREGEIRASASPARSLARRMSSPRVNPEETLAVKFNEKNENPLLRRIKVQLYLT